MGSERFEKIRAELARQKAKWEATDHEFLKLSIPELGKRLGVIVDEKLLAEMRAMPKVQVYEATATLSPSVDWRNYNGRNCVTIVKNQESCGSCVSFGTTATLESMILIEHGLYYDLSEAELLFCGGGSCGGWWPQYAINYLTNRGISQESCFPYQPQNMSCNTCSQRDSQAWQIQNNVTLWNINDRKAHLANVGPTMGIFNVFEDFYGYSTGVYSYVHGQCVGSHCIEVIGYDDVQGCWICKNSWGPSWGDGGFFRIAYGQCGIDSNNPFWGIGGTKRFGT